MDEKCITLLCIIHIHRISELSVHVDIPKGLWTSSYLQCSAKPGNRLIILIFSQSLSPSHVIITDYLSAFSQCELYKDMYK